MYIIHVVKKVGNNNEKNYRGPFGIGKIKRNS